MRPRLSSSFTFGCLMTCVCFLSVTWFQSAGVDNNAQTVKPAVLLQWKRITAERKPERKVYCLLSSGSPDLESVNQRLLVARGLWEQVNQDLHLILEQIQNFSKAENETETTTAAPAVTQRHLLEEKPNVYLYLPHLREHPHGLEPHVLLSQGRTGVSVVLGVPTVKRVKQSYLVATLGSLLLDLSSSQRRDLLLIVFVAETDYSYATSVADTISTNFPKEVESGLLEVVSPSEHFYPNISSLQETFGDSKERVRWRTKQNLDYCFLMLYAQDKGRYYVQLEDDIVAKSDYYESMKSFVLRWESSVWLYLEFSQLGFIGKLFRSCDLPMVVGFFLMFHKDKPGDWLLDHVLWVKVCHPERDSKHCVQQKALLKRTHKPSLFQHVGTHSSLSGKTQPLKDKDFGQQQLFSPHLNPAARLSSSLRPHGTHSLDRVYSGLDFLWAQTPVQGDYILIRFLKPVYVRRFLFSSGNVENSLDKFYNTTVEVQRSSVLESNQTSGLSLTSDGFTVVGHFVEGRAEGGVNASLSALRLTVQHDSQYWVVLKEIFIEV